jgi:hypothetical protein
VKRVFVLIVVLISLTMPAFAQWRFDIGIDMPLGVTMTMGGNTISSFLPIPDLGLCYQWTSGNFNLGLGVRAFTLLVESGLWPNAFAEYNVGPVVIEAQMGGAFFALLGAYNNMALGIVLIPDLSAWFKIGKTGAFRVGGGFIALYAPYMTGNTVPALFYLGGKVALDL